MTEAVLGSFILTCLLIELTPGPNMTYLALISAAYGRRAGFAMVAGIALGLSLIGAVSAFGVAEIIQSSDFFYNLLRWAGVLYLLYLAWNGWVTASNGAEADDDTEGRYFLRGIITNILNPKAGIFFIAVLPTFIDRSHPPVPQAMILTALYVAVATFVHAGIVGLAGSFQVLINVPSRERLMRRTLSAILAAIALWFAWSSAR
ncbi:Threonine/homoserine/homoserine lactone efflux protein [Beijerinckia sp. 28-YEA-48]|nr:Threonine/homoserine/homoserine lactone efflux protein [Beijerinckia sp. 28-YEA-48]